MDRLALLSLHSSPLSPIGSADVGGMQVYVRRLAEELSRLGIRVDVFTRRTDPEAPECVRTSDGARVVHLAAGPPSALPKSVLPLHIPALANSFRAFVRRERVRYDILHSHYWISGMVALRATGEVPAPVVHMFHTLSRAKEFYNGGPDPTDSALRPCAERAIIERADVIVGATHAERHEMERLYGVEPASYDVIPPGVDLDVFAPRGRDDSRRLLGLNGRHILLYVGRPDGIKGLDLLLRSVAEIAPAADRGLKLVVVGDLDGEGSGPRGHYRRLAHHLGLEEIVEFRGIVPQHQLPLYYSAADLCAVPSTYESFGLVAVESMACQTPVVAFAVGGLADTITDEDTGFLAPPGNRAAFSRQLSRALESKRLKEMGRRGRLSVRQYAWSNVVSRTLALYERVLEESRFFYRASCGS